jgi:hypothetical protein
MLEFIENGYRYKDLLNDCIHGTIEQGISLYTGIAETEDGYNLLYGITSGESFQDFLNYFGKDMESFKKDVACHYVDTCRSLRASNID